MTDHIKPPRSEECEWRSGPPPEIGWWPASVKRNPNLLRYWNGLCWSEYVYSSADAATAGDFAKYKSIDSQSEIKWTDRWWLE